jgi:hypothetical protein
MTTNTTIWPVLPLLPTQRTGNGATMQTPQGLDAKHGVTSIRLALA